MAVLIKLQKETFGRRRPQAAWGWSGVAESPDLSANRSQVRAAVDLLPTTLSDRDRIVELVLELGAQFYRNLHQDEFGPPRADRSAALNWLARSIDVLQRQLSKLPEKFDDQLNLAVASFDPGESLRNCNPYEIVNQEFAAIELLLQAIEGVQGLRIGNQIGGSRIFARLQHAASRSLSLLAALDTTSEFEIRLAPLPVRDEAVPSPLDDEKPIAIVRHRVSRLRTRIELARGILARQKGPEARVSLALFVAQLATLWSAETGLAATSSSVVTHRQYIASPQSPAGLFIAAATEAVRPPTAWFDEHQSSADTVAARIMIGPAGDRLRAINTALTNYVTSRRSTDVDAQKAAPTS